MDFSILLQYGAVPGIIAFLWNIYIVFKAHKNKNEDFFKKYFYEIIVTQHIINPMTVLHNNLIGKTDSEDIKNILLKIQEQLTRTKRYLEIFQSLKPKETSALQAYISQYEDDLFDKFEHTLLNSRTFLSLELFALNRMSIIYMRITSLVNEITIKDIKNVLKQFK